MSSRKAFEEGPGAGLSLGRREDGTYISITTLIAWESWQAATNRAANLCETPIGRKLATIQNGPDQLAELIRNGNDCPPRNHERNPREGERKELTKGDKK